MKTGKYKGSASVFFLRCGKRGFAIMEIVLLLVIIGVIGVNIVLFQNNTWKRVGSSNNLLIAGQMIEEQIESLRMWVDDPSNNFPPADSSFTKKGITLSWSIVPAYRKISGGVALTNVRQCYFTAWWGAGKDDTLNVTTYLAKNF